LCGLGFQWEHFSNSRMHRRAIISDIHGNLLALEAVLADIQTQSVDDIVCLGDICGYGPQPAECIARVRSLVKWTLLGNHDEAVFREPLNFSKNAYDSIVWQRTVLDPEKVVSTTDAERETTRERWEWLKTLEPSRSEKNVRYVHASPRDPIHEYILREDFDISCGGPSKMGTEIMKSVEWLCFCGHSHRPGVVAEDYKWWLPENLAEHKSLIRSGFKTIVNVGSVGQPRDGIKEACYAIFEYNAPIDPPPPPAEVHHEPGTTVILNVRGSAASTIVNTKIAKPVADPLEWTDDETRNEKDVELQQARESVILMTPKVYFRRVSYDIQEAQNRFLAIAGLPQHNALRLSMGK